MFYLGHWILEHSCFTVRNYGPNKIALPHFPDETGTFFDPNRFF